MSALFFEKPIFDYPLDHMSQHWELDETGQPIHQIIQTRRRSELTTPIPKVIKGTGKKAQQELDIADGTSDEELRYHSSIINGVRAEVDRLRAKSASTAAMCNHS